MSSLFSDAGNAVFPAPDAQIRTVRPRTEAELAEVMRAASEAGEPMTLSAALTGLTGAAVPRESGVLIDLTGLDTVPDRAGWKRITPFLLIDERDSSRGIVAPGVSLNALNEALDDLDLWYPPHPGELRASLGGNVSTNASGPRTFAFGATREYVQSLRLVLPEGEPFALRRGELFAAGRRITLKTPSGRTIETSLPSYTAPEVKNAAGVFVEPGMDLLDVFIGSEGLLGAFTELGLRFLPRRPIRSEVYLFTTPAEALACVDALRPLKARADLYPLPEGDGVVSLEFFDGGSLDLVRDDRRFSAYLAREAGAAVEVEFFADDAATRVKVVTIAERLGCRGAVPPALSAAFRYAVPRRVADLLKERTQPKFGTDFAVPLPAFRELYDLYERIDEEFAATGPSSSRLPRTAKWGHVGDCHLHCNFLCESEDDQALARALYLKLVRKAVALGGTVSAEHGVGKKTLADEAGVPRPYLWYQYGDAGLRDIATLKSAFDPKGLLNAGNMGVGLLPG